MERKKLIARRAWMVVFAVGMIATWVTGVLSTRLGNVQLEWASAGLLVFCIVWGTGGWIALWPSPLRMSRREKC